MHNEIGGYMELESFRGKEMYDGLLKFNLGRTAFVWLLQNIEHDRVFIPEYICDSVPSSAEKAGFKVVRYRLDENLEPVWGAEGTPKDTDILYLVSFYGQLTEEQVRAHHEKHPLLIVDYAQAFYDAPIDEPGIHTIYTPRKFFGVSDGGYVASDIRTGYDNLPVDRSGSRMKHLIGRLEEDARSHYSEMRQVSDTFADEIPRKMSPLTENILKGTDYEYVQERRLANYRTLKKLLPGDNVFTKVEPSCPFAYPYYHEDGVNLRKYLASKNIFVPTNWTYLLKKLPEDSLEYDWSANILPLPVDQRYGEEEMQIIAEAIRSY